MKLFGLDITRARSAPPAPEQRSASIENPTVPVTAENLLAFVGRIAGSGPVSIDEALEVPAVLAATTFLPRTLAALPLHLWRKTEEGPARVSGGLQTLIHEAPNPDWTSFGWRQYIWHQFFTGGRAVSWIERSGSNILGIWPIDPTKLTVKVQNGRRWYQVRGRDPYPAADVIDLPFMLKPDQVTAIGPIAKGARTIRTALDMNDYASSFFAGGGVPPMVMTGPMPTSADSMRRAMEDVRTALDVARESGKPVFQMPLGHELKPVGFDPAKGQLVEASAS